MGVASEYSLEIQAFLVAELCVLHNFICTHNSDNFDNIDINAELEC
jgi:hypothetical protein